MAGLSPPAGVTPNFVDPYSYQGAIIATLVVCLVSTTPAIMARVYTKALAMRSSGWDDCEYHDVLAKDIGAFLIGQC